MDNKVKLHITKIVHTAVYFLMVAAVIYTFYCAMMTIRNYLLFFCIILVMLEGVVFLANGRRCPFTDLANKYGDKKGYVGDMFVPRTVAENTFWMFAFVFFISLIILFLNKV